MVNGQCIVNTQKLGIPWILLDILYGRGYSYIGWSTYMYERVPGCFWSGGGKGGGGGGVAGYNIMSVSCFCVLDYYSFCCSLKVLGRDCLRSTALSVHWDASPSTKRYAYGILYMLDCMAAVVG